MANPYVKLNVTKASDNSGLGGNKKAELILTDCEDVLTFPSRDEKGIVITDNVVMKPGKYMISLYVTQSTIKAGADAAGDPDAKGIEQSIEAEHPGDAVALREFRTNWQNKNMLIFIRKCGSNKTNMYGDECSPMQLVFKSEDDKDKNKTTFTFKSLQKGPDVADYQGTFTFDSVIGTIPANADTINVAAGPGRYQLTSGTASAIDIINISNAIDGESYTFIGSGGAHPSTFIGAPFLNRGGDWTAITGSEITYKAYLAGFMNMFFLEISRK